MTTRILQDSSEVALSERVRRYVARDMSQQQASEFERELLASPALQTDVEAELILREHAHALVGTPASFLARAHSGFESHWWGMAAGLVLALGVGFGAGRLSPLADNSQASGESLALVLLTQTRGSATQITAPAGKIFVARVLTGTDAAHDLTLSDPTGKPVRRWENQRPSADGYITLLSPALPANEKAYAFEISQPSPQRFEILLR